MKKIIAALDGLKLSHSTIDYSAYFAKEYGWHIVAAFLEDIAYHSPVAENHEEYKYADLSKMDELIEKEDRQKDAAIGQVRSRFDVEGVQYDIHQNKTLALDALILESCYADLVIIDGDERFASSDRSKPAHFIKSFLSDTLSPVLVVPPTFKRIEKIVFAYDGSPSSVYAIKQFSYLFPASDDQQVEVLMITDDKHSDHFPNHQLLQELLERRYRSVTETIIRNEETPEALLTHLQQGDKQPMVVLGAYQRSSISRWLHQSKADLLIAETQLPVFIAHA